MDKPKAAQRAGKEVTLKFIADHVGTSVATASLVINRGKGYERISAATAQRVMDACKQFGYKPHFFAQGLKRNTTMQIVLAVPDIYNPFSHPLIQGVKSVLSAEGYNTIVLDFTGIPKDSEPEQSLRNALSPLIHGGIDGIISHVTWGSLKDLVPQTMPVIHIDDDIRPGVGFNAEKAGYLLTDLFLRQGCEGIAFVDSVIDSHTYRCRLEGYRRAFAEHGAAVDESLIFRAPSSPQGGLDAFQWLINLPRLPRAVVVCTDIITHVLQLKLLGAGIRIPRDMGIASVDDTYLSRLMLPPLTCVHVPAFEMGERAATMMLRLLADQPLEQDFETVDIRLNVRESSWLGENQSWKG